MLQSKCLAATASLTGILLPGLSLAATLNVPGDFATIQACIDVAVSGVDECVVAPGTYHETINFLGKAITVRSSGGRDATTIDATGIGGSVVTSSSQGTGTILDGFTITGGTGTDLFCDGITIGGGMLNRKNATVKNCGFSGNNADAGGGIVNFVQSNVTITNCTFDGNYATYSGGGMLNWFSTSSVTNCTFRGNTAAYGAGIYNDYSTVPPPSNCPFSRNRTEDGPGMYNGYSEPTTTHCTFSGNRAMALRRRHL